MFWYFWRVNDFPKNPIMPTPYLFQQMNDPARKEIPFWLKALIRDRFIKNLYGRTDTLPGKVFKLKNLVDNLNKYNRTEHNGAYQHGYDELRASWGGKYSRVISKSYRNFLCLYAAGMDWDALCNKLEVTEDESYYDPNYIYQAQQKEKSTPNKKKADDELTDVKEFLIEAAKKPDTLEIINSKSFEKERALSELVKSNDARSFYTSFNNNYLYLKRIVANEIHVSPDNTLNVYEKSDGQKSSLKINQIPALAISGQATLLKITGVGGAGKSTLLWHLIKELATEQQVYYLIKWDISAIDYIFQGVSHTSPVILFLDEIIRANDENDEILKVAQKLAIYGLDYPIILICTERNFRYEKFKGKWQFQNNFGKVLDLYYSNKDLREDVFQKVMQLLIPREDISFTLEKECRKKFNEFGFESLIDSNYNLISYISNKTLDLSYSFEWNDWEFACDKFNKNYKDLFKVVSFFYRFGVEVPIDYLSEYYLKEPFIKDDLLKLLGSFQNEYSPIIFNQIRGTLRLRHEKIAEWFFKLTPSGSYLEEDFFSSFIKNIKTKSSAYLFRNLFRKNPEFENTSFFRLLSSEQKLQIINRYFLSINIDKSEYTEDEQKMLMEKHFYLFNQDQLDEAIETLRDILIADKDNIHALTRIGYCLQTESPELAEEKFKEVLQIAPTNGKATLSLLKLYYDHGDLKFETHLEDVFHLAKDNTNFAFEFLDYIAENFTKIDRKLTDMLTRLCPANILFRLKIIDLYILKKKYEEATSLIEEVNQTNEISDKLKLRLSQYLIDIYERRDFDNLANPLSRAEQILFSTRNHQKSFQANLLLGRIYSNKGNPDEAIKYFNISFNLDKHNDIVFKKIVGYYRDLSKNAGSNEVSLKYLLEAQNFIQHRIDRFHGTKDNLDLINLELAVIKNELFKYFLSLSKKEPLYIDDAVNIFITCEGILKSITQAINVQITGVVETFYYNPVYDTKIYIHSKASSLLKILYLRINDAAFKDSLEIIKSREFLAEAQLILDKAFLFDNKNPILINDLLEVNLKLKNTSIINKIDSMNFDDFNIPQKRSLCKLLLKYGYKDVVKRLLLSWPFLNSSDPFVKNDLVFLYTESSLYGHAIKIMAEISGSSNYVLELYEKLALSIPPVKNYDRINTKIKFSKYFLENSASGKYRMHLNLCEAVFKIGEIENSRIYYNEHILSKTHVMFKVKSAEWMPDLLHNLLHWIGNINNLKKPMFLIERVFDSLFALEYDFEQVKPFPDPTVPFNEEIKTIVRTALNPLFNLMLSRSKITEEVFRFLKYIGSKYDNSFLSQTIIRKLTHESLINKLSKTDYQQLLKDFESVIKSFEGKNRKSMDFQLLLGRYYLQRFMYFESKRHYNEVFRDSRISNVQKCTCFVGFAKIDITIIETQKSKAFGGSLQVISERLQNAHKNLNRALKAFPEFSYAEKQFQRIYELNRILKLNLTF